MAQNRHSVTKYAGDRQPPKFRLSSMGWDGLAMLLLSVGWLTATGGLSLFYFLWLAHKVAKHTTCSAPAGNRKLVLGACLNGGRLPDDFLDRLRRAQQLPAGRIMILGGRTSRSSTSSEAAAGRDWLVARGVDSALIDLEDRSRNTLENLRGARERLDAGDRPVLITSRYHLARASQLARGLDIDHVLCAAEDNLCYSPRLLRLLFLEAFFLNWYAVGRTVAQTLRHRGMLARIT